MSRPSYSCNNNAAKRAGGTRYQTMTREWTRIQLCKAVSDIKWSRLAIRDLTPDAPLEIHIFADASTQSYDASAFLVTNNQSRIYWAKNKLVPLKNQPTIPRLELNSCLLGSILPTYIHHAQPPRLRQRHEDCTLDRKSDRLVLAEFGQTS